jgi:hypothetical protein
VHAYRKDGSFIGGAVPAEEVVNTTARWITTASVFRADTLKEEFVLVWTLPANASKPVGYSVGGIAQPNHQRENPVRQCANVWRADPASVISLTGFRTGACVIESPWVVLPDRKTPASPS